MQRIILSLVLLLCESAHAAVIGVACDFLAISNACCVTAVEGDTVSIAAGSCIMTNQITIDRNISFTISGAGSNSTTLTAASGVGKTFQVISTSTNVFTISSLDCKCGPDTQGWLFTGQGIGFLKKTQGVIRMTSCQITNIGPGNVGVVIGWNDAYTLVDRCRLVSVGANFGNHIQFYGNDFYSWAGPTNLNPLGTANASVVEDCTFINNSSAIGNGFFDGYDGGCAVLRHCFFNGNAATGTHGYDSSYTAMRSLEVYNCTFTNIDQFLASIRGGGYMFYSNTVYTTHDASDNSGINAIGPTLQYYRAAWTNYQGAYGYPFWPQTNWWWIDNINNYEYITNLNHVPTNGELLCNYNGGTQQGILHVAGLQNIQWSTSSADMTAFGKWGYVLAGSSIASSLTNLCALINQTPSGAGVVYNTFVTNGDWPGNLYQTLNFYQASVDSTLTNIVIHNRIDGTGSFGWPAAEQPGILHMTLADTNHYAILTNTGQTQFPCYQWSNTLTMTNGTTKALPWILSFASLNNTPNHVTDLLIEGRDFTNYVIPASYSPLTYPFQLPAGPSIVSRSGPGRSRKPR